MATLRLAEATARPLNIAGACGVPFVGAAGIIIQDIVKLCDEVKLHKQKSRLLSSKCMQIFNSLNERESDLEGSELQQAADELKAILERVKNRTSKWSTYSSVVTFLHSGEIKEGLERCHSELDEALSRFHINSNIINHATQRDILKEIRRDSEEKKEFLLAILSMQSERQQVVALQRQGEHVAEELMAAGQQQLRLLRREGPLVENDMPTPTEAPSAATSLPYPQIQDSQQYLQYQRGLISLHRETGIPPTIKILNGEVTRTSELAVAGGTYSDIWVGLWLGEEKVALKAIRNARSSDRAAKKRFENEINMWANLRHDHILPFYGIVTDLDQHIHLVSPWQEDGNVLGYVKAHRDANRTYLISGGAQGLEYLHSSRIIHGNIKCANILVSSKGEACICDFGMSKLIEDVTERNASLTLTEGGSARWLAPELIEGKALGKEADVYSFAMAVLELLSEKHPYPECKRDAQVIHRIVVQKKPPERPINEAAEVWLSDGLWNLMRRCWHKDASARPSMGEVSVCTQEINHTYAALTESPQFVGKVIKTDR